MGPTADRVRPFEPITAGHAAPAAAPARGTDTSASGAALPVSRHWAGTVGRLLRSGLAVLLVCAVLTPAAHAFEWCPNALGPDAWCPDGWACCPYPYGPGYWC